MAARACPDLVPGVRVVLRCAAIQIIFQAVEMDEITSMECECKECSQD